VHALGQKNDRAREIRDASRRPLARTRVDPEAHRDVELLRRFLERQLRPGPLLRHVRQRQLDGEVDHRHQAVACPTSSNIIGVYNNGYAGQIYFQNVVFPVAAIPTFSGGSVNSQFPMGCQ
jgi:hypothetical protein